MGVMAFSAACLLIPEKCSFNSLKINAQSATYDGSVLL